VPWCLLGLSIARAVRRTPPGPVFNFYLALAAAQLILFAGALTVALLLR
jgi:hypothetical protein